MEDILKIAKIFVKEYFSQCDGAMLSGSVVRGAATKTSDLDIIIYDLTIPNGYRQSMTYQNWPIEVFVHNPISIEYYSQMDIKDGTPTLPQMIVEGLFIKEHVDFKKIKLDAQNRLDQGPLTLTEAEIENKRYCLTDQLEDFIGCNERYEGLFIATQLMFDLSAFYLGIHQAWQGKSKWMMRALKRYDEVMALQIAQSFESYFQEGHKTPVIELVDKILMLEGGRLFAGYERGKS